MKPYKHRSLILLVVGAVAAWSAPVFTQAPERLSNNDVKVLIAQVDEGRDKFDGNLDGSFKSSILRGPTGEAMISAALDDYKDNTKKLKDRFTDDYSASTEVATVLRQSTAIDKFMQNSATGMKGRSEWDSQVTNLKRLAAAYDTTFPLPDGGTARRMNDRETAAEAAAVSAAAERFKSDVGKEKTLPKSDLDAARKDIDLLIKKADAIKSRTSEGKPATAELRQLVEQVDKLQAFVDTHQIPTAAANWKALQTSLGNLQVAFGVRK